jgi:hypothetical protein
MGLETQCTLERDRRSDHIAFRGRTQSARFLLADVSHVEVEGDVLVLTHRDGAARLHLREGMAATWLAKIRNPRSLLDKLGVREGMRVAVIGVDDADFLRQLRERVGRYDADAQPSTDVVVLGIDAASQLSVLAALKSTLVPNGAIWVVHRKGKEATVRDVDVFAAGRAAGLVDNKVAAFSPTHTAERLVIPRAAR